MKLKRYWKYFKYVMNHKKDVFKECWKEKLYIQAFTHDLSKFSFVEFFSYANYFFGDNKSENNKLAFEYGWLHHQRKNKHHWNYWVNSEGECLEMPYKYMLEMICDWKAMSAKFRGSAKEYYYKGKNKIKLHKNTRDLLEHKLQENNHEKI